MIERPAGAGGPTPLPEDIAEQLLAGPASEKHILFRSMVITVSRGDRDALDAELHGRIKELRDALGILADEQRAVDGHSKALAAREADCRYRLVEDTLLAHRLIMTRAIPVQVNGKCQIWRRLVLVNVPGKEERIGAEVDEFLARTDAADDLGHLLVDQRFAAGNGHDGRPAFIDR